VTATWLPKIDCTASAVPPMPSPVNPSPAMIGFAFSLSITNHSSAEATTQARQAISIAKANDPVATMPRIVAHAPMIITPSRPRCQTPERWASTPASVT